MHHGISPSLTLEPRPAEPADGRTAAFQAVLSFGSFVAVPAARTLLRSGSPVCLGARAFDLLVLLLASRGKLVSKEAIMRHVWPTTTVDESNLRFQMGVLRKALGPESDLIKTIPGRGYLLADSIDIHGVGCSFEASAQRPSTDGEERQRAVGEALCTLLRVLDCPSSSITLVEGLISGNVPKAWPGAHMTESAH